MRKKVLVVEDNSDLLELLASQLRYARFQVATANNGIDGLKLARSFAPDIVLLDLVLPQLDGFAVCEHLRRDPQTARIPILLLTGLASEISRCAGFESGADDYVTKPATADVIVSKIRHWLSKPVEPRGPAVPKRTLARADTY